MSVTTSENLGFPRFPIRRFTVREYHRLGDTGALTEEDRVELLNGWITPKMMRSPTHDATVGMVENALRERLPDGWHIRNQSATTTKDSEPEPDLAVIRGSVRDYVDRHPTPEDVALVIEVAETSLARDRAKCQIYAEARIENYWIVNLVDSQIEVYSRPSVSGHGAKYEQLMRCDAPMTIPLIVEGQTVAQISVDDLMP